LRVRPRSNITGNGSARIVGFDRTGRQFEELLPIREFNGKDVDQRDDGTEVAVLAVQRHRAADLRQILDCRLLCNPLRIGLPNYRISPSASALRALNAATQIGKSSNILGIVPPLAPRIELP